MLPCVTTGPISNAYKATKQGIVTIIICQSVLTSLDVLVSLLDIGADG